MNLWINEANDCWCWMKTKGIGEARWPSTNQSFLNELLFLMGNSKKRWLLRPWRPFAAFDVGWPTQQSKGNSPAPATNQQSNFFAHSRRQRNGVGWWAGMNHEINCFWFGELWWVMGGGTANGSAKRSEPKQTKAIDWMMNGGQQRERSAVGLFSSWAAVDEKIN